MWIGTKSIPAKWMTNIEIVKAKAKALGYNYIFIDNSNYLDIIERDSVLSKYSFLYNSLPYLIMKCDMLRYASMYKYGGLYIDLDYRLVGDLNSLWQCVGNTKHITATTLNSRSWLANGLIMSTQHNPIWISVMDSIAQNYNSYWYRILPQINYVYNITGPSMLQSNLNKYKNNTITIPSTYVYYFDRSLDYNSNALLAKSAILLYEEDVNSSWHSNDFIYYSLSKIKGLILLITIILIITVILFKIDTSSSNVGDSTNPSSDHPSSYNTGMDW